MMASWWLAWTAFDRLLVGLVALPLLELRGLVVIIITPTLKTANFSKPRHNNESFFMSSNENRLSFPLGFFWGKF